MKRLAIITMLLISGSAFAQRYVISSDGTNLWSKNSGGSTNIIAQGITNYFKPAVGYLNVTADPFLTADSVYVTNGTIDSGSVTNTRALDNSYLVIGENAAQSWQVDFTFTNGALTPHVIKVDMYYQGSLAHANNISVSISNVVSGTFSNIVTGGFDYDGVETAYNFAVPQPETNYVSTNGVTVVRFLHGSSGVGTHEVGFDYVALLEAQLDLNTSGTYYAVSPLSSMGAVNVTADTTNGTLTTIDAGWYRCYFGGSGTGTDDTTYRARIETNSADTAIGFTRTIGTEGSFGNANSEGLLYLPAGTTCSVSISASTTNSWASFEKAYFGIIKQAN